MRLVLVVPAFPKLSESFIVAKFLGLLEKGWDVHVFCQRSDVSEWERFPALRDVPGVRRRIHVGWPVRPAWKPLLLGPLVILGALLAQPQATWRYLRRGIPLLRGRLLKQLYLDARLLALQPDLVHFEFGALAPNRMVLKRLLGCRVTVSFRGYDINFVGLDQERFYDPVWEQADGLHFLGQDLWRRAQRRGCPPEKVHVLIPPAIDTDFFSNAQHKAPNGSAPLRILSVGRLEWKKGYEYALEAVRRLRDEAGVDLEYRIVGDGDYLEPLAFLIHTMKLKDSVALLGSLPREAVREQLSWADVFLQASVSEGFCNAVVEAQAMQLPVVSSDADGLPENVADGVTGFIVPRRDPAALADRLHRLAGDPPLRKQMGRAGRQRVLDCFQLADQIDAFDSFYRGIYAH